jgi:carboxylate-amine ligase
VADLLEHVRPALRDAGDEQRVADGTTALLGRGTGADLQRRVHADTGDLAAVVGTAVAVTSGQDDDAARAAVLPTG